MATRTRGGKKLDAFLRKAKTAKGVNAVEIGFYSTAKYPDGTSVTNVALWQEFGFESKYFPVQAKDGTWIFIKRQTPKQIPERPFFRQSIAKMPDRILPILKAEVNPRTMVIDRRTATLVGMEGQSIIKDQIVLLREPANAQSTIDMKGSSSPLVDTSFMRNNATWRITG